MGKDAWNDVRGKLDFTRAGRPALIGMAAVLALVAVAVGFVLSSAATTSNFTVSSNEKAVDERSDEQAATIFVHISGSVANPGLFELPLGARVDDAVRQAGGFAEDADENACNLARTLEDGEHVIIPAISSSDGGENGEEDANHDVSPNPATTLININTANEAQLQSLPGIGPAMARKIIAERTANGPFKSIQDLTRVSGIGDKKLSAIVDLICV